MKPTNTAELKKTNKRNIYFCIYRKKRTSKQEIASDLHLSLPTVSQNLQELENSCLIKKDGYMESTGGRKANILVFNATAKISIGIEILKNGIEIVAADLYGTVLKSKKTSIAFSIGEPYFKFFGSFVNRFISSLPFPPESISGIGIVLQGLISADGTTVTYGKILDCTGLTIDRFSKYLHYPSSMIHDAEAAATDELWNSPDTSDAIFFHIRTNLSGAIIVDGKFLKGRELKSGVFEHMTIVPNGHSCYCGKKGCIESYCSLSALLDEDESLNNFFQKLRYGNSIFENRWKSYLEYLSVAIDNLHMLIDCDIILGGSLAPYLIQNDLDCLHRYVMDRSAFPTQRKFISISKCSDKPVALGAALPYVKHCLDTIAL